jgi:hypothetical protein
LLIVSPEGRSHFLKSKWHSPETPRCTEKDSIDSSLAWSGY